MRFRLLGPVEVRTSLGWREITTPKWKALLVCLILHADQVVSTEVLVETLWGKHPPAKARNLISVYVHRLRRLMEDDDAQLLVTRAPGFRLLAGPRDTDLAVFESRVAAAEQSLAEGRAERASDLYREALALWRGPALCDVPQSPLTLAVAARLQEVRLRAIEQRIAADLACGRGESLIPELRRLVAEHPLREGTWALLMRVLAGADRHSEALEAFAEARAKAIDGPGMRAGLSLNYHSLGEAERRAFRRLGLLGDSDFPEWVVAEVLSGDDPVPGAGRVAETLADRGLLTPLGQDDLGQARYRLQPLMRDFARGCLAEEPARERDRVRSRVLRRWAGYAAVADRGIRIRPVVPSLAGKPDEAVLRDGAFAERLVQRARRWFLTEWPNLVGGVELACATGDYETAIHLAAGVEAFLYSRSRGDDTLRLWEPVLRLAEREGDVATAASIRLRIAGITVGQRTQADPAVTDMLDACEATFGGLGETAAHALTCCLRSQYLEQRGLYDDARVAAERALDLARVSGSREAELAALLATGLARAQDGRYEEGERQCEYAVALARELEDPSAETRALYTLAKVRILARRYRDAINACAEALDSDREPGRPDREPHFLTLVGDAYLGLGAYEDAVDCFVRAKECFERSCDLRAFALCTFSLARCQWVLGRRDEAGASLRLFNRIA
jgi:DNA-binding SARP family transcriptional activator